MQLPQFRALDVKQSPSQLTKTQCDKLDHIIAIVPKKPAKAVLRSLPFGEHLRRSFERGSDKGEGRVASRLANKRATGVTIATLDDTSPYALLTWARQLVADCKKEKPVRLGVTTAGLADAPRERALNALVAAADAAAFELPSFKSDAKPRPRPKLRVLTVFGAKTRLDLATTRATALGNNIARWFTAMPPNELTAATYRDALQSIAEQYGFKYAFLNESALGKLGAGAFLAVSQGNAMRDAGIVHLKYRPGGKAAPDLALVGKGILFDTGGTNLKNFKGMLDMHTDMQGSAVALGSLVALAELKVPYAVDLWLAVTENRISATAYKSQDVVRACNGTTIQVIHTDAEGRMVLADTLAVASRERPKLIIDYATLTGSCVAALTSRYSGVFSNRSDANALLQRAGHDSGERVWPFPMDEDFEEALRSETADIKQCTADGYGDHILAARFLMRFVPKDIPWIHVDLSSGQHKGGLAQVPTEITGFGVRLTVELLRQGGSAAALAARLES